MTPLIIKRYNNQNIIAQMYQADFNAEENIVNDFTEILDKIIIDIYLKKNVFLKEKPFHMADEEKKEFVLKKRNEILEAISKKEFELTDYINSDETTFKMTACVKCNCLGICEEGFEDWKKDNPNDIYCEYCKCSQDDFKRLL